MDNVYLNADEYIEYTCEQADKIMQMKLGKDYDNYIVYDKAGKETSYTEEGQDIFIDILDDFCNFIAHFGMYSEEDRDDT